MTACSFPMFTVITVALMLRSCTGSPMFPSVPDLGETEGPQVHRGAQQGQSPRVRAERFAPLPEDQRRFTSKQILQALSEIMQRDDCISDYQGWVDFGRRSTD